MTVSKIAFTPARVAAFNVPKTGRVFFYDADAPGLAVRVSAHGERVFYLRRKVAGNAIKIALGPFDSALPASRRIPSGVDPLVYIGNRPRLNLRMARALASAVSNELSKGVNPSEVARTARRKRDGELTLAAAFDRYEADHLLAQERRSAVDLRNLYERYLGVVPPGTKKPHGRPRTKSPHGVDWSARRLTTITTNEVRRLMAALKDGHGVASANRSFELLRSMYNRLIEWKLHDGPNPCAGLSKFGEHSRDRFLRGEELPAFFGAYNALSEGAFKDFVALALYTGARRGNVLGARWADVDLHAGLWTIPGKLSKSAKPMTLPLTRGALEVFRRRRAADPDGAFVFPAESVTGHMVMPKRTWAAFVKAAGLSDFRLHDLRRSAGSWAAMTGASLPIIGKALGHKSSASTEVYARLQTDPVLAALQRAQDAMAQAAGAPGAQVHDLGQRRRSRPVRR